MAPDVTKPRYPKRKRAEVNYEIDLSIDGDLDLEDDRNVSEELGEDVPAPASAANPANARQPDPIVEVDSEFEDATFGSRKVKKRKVIPRPKKVKLPKFKPFRLMDLPAELRTKVYEEALVDPHGVNIRTYSDKWESVPVHVCIRDVGTHSSTPNPSCYVRGKWTKLADGAVPRKKFQLSPNLLAASKTVHAEAVSLLWTQPFIFDDVKGLHSFLQLLSHKTISRLRDITLLWCDAVGNKCLLAFVLLRDAPLLRNLRFDSSICPVAHSPISASRDSFGEKIATKLYRDCHPFLKALVKHQGPEAILQVIKFHKDEFKNNWYNYITNTWIRHDWSQEREDKVLKSMVDELNTIMSRKIAVKFRRSR